MSRERDIERVLDAWLAQGPTVMPDRLFDGVLDRIERQPQRRLARLQRRFATMRPITIFAAAAAIAVAVGAGIVLLGRPSTPDVAAPTTAPSVVPTPTAVPSPSPVAGLPDGVAGTWIRAPRALPASGISEPAVLLLDLGTVGTATQVRADPGTMRWLSEGGWRFGSRGSSPAPGRLAFETTLAVPNAGCDVGTVGEYAYTLYDDGRVLDLAAVDEPCAGRAEAYAGTWRLRDCRLPRSNLGTICAGDLPAGTHTSAFFDPWNLSDGAYGALRLTVPEGWSNSEDFLTSFFLVPSEEYAKEDGGDLESWHGIYVQRAASAAAQDEECSNVEQPGVARTLDGLTAWLAAHPGLAASEPLELTIDFKRATLTDLAIDPAWTATCPDAPGGHPLVALFREADDGGWDWGLGWPGNQDRQRVILVELEPENVMLIAINDTNSQARFDELVAKAMPIVESFEFRK